MLVVRTDLAEAQAAAWQELGSAGPCFTGAQRVELMQTAIDAYFDRAPLPPWVTPSSVTGRLPANPLSRPVAHDIVFRVAAHAGTLTESWYRSMVDQVGERAYIELVALTCTVVPIISFRRALGLEPWAMPAVVDGPPTNVVAESLASATLNWVPVAAPADQTASVLQAFTALPTENARVWRLAATQYIPNDEMSDPHWTRGTLTRPQIELVAMRVSQLRQCFF